MLVTEKLKQFFYLNKTSVSAWEFFKNLCNSMIIHNSFRGSFGKRKNSVAKLNGLFFQWNQNSQINGVFLTGAKSD